MYLFQPSDKLYGTLLLVSTIVAGGYYAFWLLITPFIDATQPILQWFPDRQYALTIPLVLFLLLLTVVGIFLGLVMIHSKAPERKVD